ncbi:MAG: VWA domain-containing protein [Acidobacteria bacterium]|nr:VWA domain-containing protein [Acidobacteriota bacterium]
MTRTTWLVTLAALTVGVVLGAQAVPQEPTIQPPVTFRSEINYVEVDARVLDAQGAFVPGLTAADFQVTEDGKPQKVAAFSFINIPVERQARPLFAKTPIERDVADNISGYDGRVYVIVLDDQHTHPLRSQRLKAAARQFVQRYMGANDTAAIVFTSGRSDVAQEFTNSQRRLLSAVDKFMGRKLRSSTLERLEEESRTRGLRGQGDRIDDPFDQERAMVARTTLDSLRDLSNYLAGISGRRKAIIYFSEGVDYDIYDVFSTSGGASAVLQASRDVVAAATRANVSIYGIDPRGLGGLADDTIEVQDTPQDASLNLGLSSFNDELRRSQDSLRVLSSETGGFAVVNQNDMATAFERVVADNSAYYLLGYYSTNERRDGRFRKIEVKVGRPGLSVRSRKGYVAARGRSDAAKDDGRTAPELRAALVSPLPTPALPLALAAAVFKGGDGKGAVVLSTLMAARDLDLVEKNGTFSNTLEVVVTATNYGGKAFAGDRATLTLALKPDSVQRLRAGGFRILSSIDLPPGRYQLRVAALEGNTKRAGSVVYDLDVPDFSKEKLSMSDLALTSSTSGLVPTARPKDPLAKMLPGPMTTYRDFVQGDEIALFAEVYDNNTRQPHKVDIEASLRAEGGQAVFETREERDSSELAGGPGGYGFMVRVPLEDVPPGLYVLRVTGTTRIGDREEVTRETVVRVVAPPAP